MTTETLLGKPHPSEPGWAYEVWAMTYGKGRIVETDGQVVTNSW